MKLMNCDGTIEFEDGSSEEGFDVVIFCTGTYGISEKHDLRSQVDYGQ